MKKAYEYLIMFLICSSTALFAAGTSAGSQIIATSTNLEVLYSSGSGSEVSQTGSDFGIADEGNNVLEINGLVETNIDISMLPAATNGVHKGLIPWVDYNLNFSYLNRGNTTEDIRIAADLEQASSRWTVQNTGIKTLAEDAIVQLQVTVNPLTAYNLERVTLNILTDLVTAARVVSYNAFAGATGLYQGSYQNNVQYGGVDDISHFYVLEAEDYDLEFVQRTSEVRAPTIRGYTGNITDPVPGAKIIYTIIFKNNSTGKAMNVQIRDKIPNNCHLYYNDTPSVEGADAYVWTGPVVNANGGPGTIVGWDMDVPAQGTVTASYTVTID